MNCRDTLAALGSVAGLTLLGGSARGASGASPVDVSPAAARLYKNALVFDANLSPPLQDKFPFPQSMLDMIRQSGVTAVKTSLGGFEDSFEDTVDAISFFQRVFEEYPDVFLQVRRHRDFEEAKRTKRMGVLLSFEAVSMLEDKIDRIELFRGLGVRVMQLTYNKASPFGTGVLGDPTGSLTPLGAKAVAAMNAQGVAIDLSHSNEPTSFAVLKITSKPALVTHAGCAAIHPHPRHKSDALLRALAQKGGVIGIYDLCYLTASPKQPDLNDYMAHMIHALNICGEDHVGIGSDSGLEPWIRLRRPWRPITRTRKSATRQALQPPKKTGRSMSSVSTRHAVRKSSRMHYSSAATRRELRKRFWVSTSPTRSGISGRIKRR